ncbi:hypothetical protein D3C78_1908380 [compost metagenome]
MGLAVFEELSGIDSGVVDPHRDIFVNMHGHELLMHQEALIATAASLARDIRKPN